MQSAQPVRAATDQPYGQAGQQQAAQRAIPLPQVMPGDFGAFNRGTERPEEPITAGLDVGPGPGSEMLDYASANADEFGDEIRAIYTKYPNNDLLRLIEAMDS